MTRSLRHARQPVHDGLQTLHVAARAVSEAEPRLALAALESALAYVEDVLMPHCKAEEFTLFIAVDGVVGHPGVSDPLGIQHRSLRAMADDLARVAEASRKSGATAPHAAYLLPLLYGLYAAARMHLESEDEAYMPLLGGHFSHSQVEVLVKNLERIASGSRR